jgi:hypothetical protein
MKGRNLRDKNAFFAAVCRPELVEGAMVAHLEAGDLFL